MTDDEKKFTQADVDRFIQERVAREKAKYADYDEIKAENADLKAKLADHESKNLDSLKAKIATDLKLPPTLAGRLQGTNEAELKADGEKLLKEIGPKEPVGGGGNPAGEVKKPLTREAVKAMKPQEIIEHMDQIKSQMKEGTLR
jgi:hypothetical protein